MVTGAGWVTFPPPVSVSSTVHTAPTGTWATTTGVWASMVTLVPLADRDGRA